MKDPNSFQIQRTDPSFLEQERRRCLQLLCTLTPLAVVKKVGSTAVAGVVGKQDIDIMVRVPAARFLESRAALDAQFAKNPVQLSNSEYQGYLIDSQLDVAVQLVVEGG